MVVCACWQIISLFVLYIGGGPWKYFVRKTGSNDLKRVAEMYNVIKETLGSEEFAECVREGAKATVNRRSKHFVHGSNSFGASKRSMLRNVPLNKLVETSAAVGGAASAMESVLDCADATCGVEDVVAKVQAIRRQEGDIERAKEREALQSLKDFRLRNTASMRSSLASIGPGLADTACNYIPVPSPVHGVMAIEYDEHTAGDLAGDLLSFGNAQKMAEKNILGHCDANWSHLHRNIAADDSSESSEADSDDYDGPCWLRQTCMCGEDDQRVDRIRNRVLRLCKQSMPFSRDKWKREALGCARIIIKFIPEIPAGGDVDEDLASFWGLDDDFRYMYISHMSFSPYCPMVQYAEEASDADALGAARAANEIAIKVNTRFSLSTKANECAMLYIQIFNVVFKILNTIVSMYLFHRSYGNMFRFV